MKILSKTVDLKPSNELTNHVLNVILFNHLLNTHDLGF